MRPTSATCCGTRSWERASRFLGPGRCHVCRRGRRDGRHVHLRRRLHRRPVVDRHRIRNRPGHRKGHDGRPAPTRRMPRPGTPRWLGDADLDNEFFPLEPAARKTKDSTSLQFPVQAGFDGAAYFNFVFASEEYNELVGTASQADALAVFVTDLTAGGDGPQRGADPRHHDAACRGPRSTGAIRSAPAPPIPCCTTTTICGRAEPTCASWATTGSPTFSPPSSTWSRATCTRSSSPSPTRGTAWWTARCSSKPERSAT